MTENTTSASTEFKMVNLTREDIIKKQQENCDSQKHLAR